MDIDIEADQLPLKIGKNRVTVLPPILESPVKKRKNASPSKSYATTGSPPTQTPTSTRKIVRATRRIPRPTVNQADEFKKNETKSPSTPKSIFILDTNILVGHSAEIRTVIEKLTRQSRLQEVYLVVTKTVLDELDKLKRDNPSLNQVCRFVRERLKCEHLIGEDYLLKSSFKAPTSRKSDLSISNNDDRILQSALVISDTFKSSYTALVTDDINLHNKCLLSRFPFLDWKEFRCKMNSEDITLSPPLPSIRGDIKHPENKKKRSLSPVVSPVIRQPQASPTLRSSVSSSPASSKSPVTSPSVRSESSSPACTYSSWVECKEKFTEQLRPFLIAYLKETYGEKLWTTIFKVDWTTCSFEEMISSLKKGWTGAFHDAFDRKRGLIDYIKTIEELRRNEMTNYPKLYTQLTHLHSEMMPYIRKSGH